MSAVEEQMEERTHAGRPSASLAQLTARERYSKRRLYVEPGAYEAPMRGSCTWCETAWNGTAEQVLAAQAAHREVCANRPAPQRYSLEQKRRMHKQGRSEEKIAAAEVARKDQAARVTARDEKARRERIAKENRIERSAEEQKARDAAVAALWHEGHSYSAIAARLNAAGVKTARSNAWTASLVGGICKRLNLRRGSGARPAAEVLAAAPLIHELRAAGLPYARIAATLNERGMLTPRGLAWSPANVLRVLRSL